MFQRFHAMREEREGGFTLIELLVVILIIAILAAIAIPVFLKQREKGWVGQMESSLKDASIAAESYATGCGDGNYTSGGGAGCAAADTDLSLADLEDEGWNPTDEVVMAAPEVAADNNSYCLEATHTRLKNDDIEPMRFSSLEGHPEENLAC
jgi:type IV pilus assembly protein PilA